MNTQTAVAEEPKPLKLDLGCGTKKQEGFFGVDSKEFPGVDLVLDLVARDWKHSADDENVIYPRFGYIYKKWPWPDESVSDVYCSHFLEHLDAGERVHFVNELFRILTPDGKALIITPHWASTRAYGDLTHKWPPVAEMWFFYLNAEWRKREAPHNDFYRCDFDATWGYGMHQNLMPRNDEYRQFAMQNYKEACTDIICTLTKHKPGETHV